MYVFDYTISNYLHMVDVLAPPLPVLLVHCYDGYEPHDNNRRREKGGVLSPENI
jgi:hypothetical protein